ncbi:hypothetical protein KL905_000169 [Ogataea polymorpha]|uniref:Protein sym1 n=1 Tax=Ogataea polymorpha TaxID=460523 RepID=A0A9P8P0Y4_9ASCO|nr:hypothetical protein KL908_001282 [Ogataea polymorpha]KAG7902585.1 hypothetical protein KL935_001493 [Ogataea polymorpha]KAG7911427.1 hypothetical protein KL906_000748 [Ogataea polymorpha]KAG7912740.1 hypothetical protein KL907_000942 [Ogataea polymorpha]KAG7919354.1 hypothetical protein KL927_001483 [Ogataea polymorpha]
MPISLPTDERPSRSRASLRLPVVLQSLLTARVRNVPVPNLLILVIFAYFLARLTTKYHQLYTKSSLVATMATNIVLYGIADTLAQSITAYCQQTSFQERNLPYNIATYLETLVPRRPEDYFVDYGEDGEISVHQVEETTESSLPTFQVRRFAGFVFWGFLMSFVQVVWYSFLNAMYKDVPTFVSVLERVLTDQLCFSPVSLACFFTYGTLVIEQGSVDDVKEKLYRVYLSTLACNFCLWFPVQFVNFLVMPKSFQVPFSSGVGVLWNCFLSLRNATS